MPFNLLSQWINEEKEAGAPDPMQAVLSTVSLDSTPHSRVVSIREIRGSELLFFTQKGTKKVIEIENNPQVSLAFWFELHQREVILEGLANPLSAQETEQYWDSYSHLSQLRFAAYAPTSGQVIASKQILENKKMAIENEYQNKKLPLNPHYCGFRIKPTKFHFYAFRLDELSDVEDYYLHGKQWHRQILSP